MSENKVAPATRRGAFGSRPGLWLARLNWRRLLPIAIIGVWALWTGRAYLNFDASIIPAGNEFNSAIQAHHLWTRAGSCGWCALWDGSERGGFPAFVDLLGSSLHPLVAITTLLFGVVNGSKVSLVWCFFLAGLAQWWLGAELRLGWSARLWGALMVMVAGHLAGKMELGLFSVVLSTSMVSFLYPAALWLARRREPRQVVVFGVILALVAVAGQGYMQLGLLATLPAYVFLFREHRPWGRLLLRRLGEAAALGTLLASPFLVPLLNFLPNIVKDGDSLFRAAQPLPYYLLNLFIDDTAFLASESLGKLPYPHLYSLFIGWIPFGLALLCLRFGRGAESNRLLFLATAAALALLAGSMLPLKWLQGALPVLANLRFAPLIGGLAIPPLIGLASFGLDKVLRVRWPRIQLEADFSERRLVLDSRLLMILPLVVALNQGYRFSQSWLFMTKVPIAVPLLLAELSTDDLQWVQPPFGEHIYIEPAVRRGLKLSPGIMAWRWRDREFPLPRLEANRVGPPPTGTALGEVGGVPIYATAAQPYASIQTATGVEPCRASGQGGWINVVCEQAEPGWLTVTENHWRGWFAWRDGERVSLAQSPWLSTRAPAGHHTYRFRYIPVDVPIGIFLNLMGVALALYWWRRPSEPDSPSHA